MNEKAATELKKYDILCLPPQDKPVYFILESRMGDDAETNAYRFEEGDCPTNFFLNGVEAIITDGDSDPHGLFQHVRSFTSADAPFMAQAHSPDAEWPGLLPEAYNSVREPS